MSLRTPDSFPKFNDYWQQSKKELYEAKFNKTAYNARPKHRRDVIRLKPGKRRTIKRTPLTAGETVLWSILQAVWLAIVFLWVGQTPERVVKLVVITFVGFWCWFVAWVVRGVFKIWAWVAMQPVLYGFHIWSWQREKLLWEQREAREHEQIRQSNKNWRKYEAKVRWADKEEGADTEQCGFLDDDDDDAYNYEYVPEYVNEEREEDEEEEEGNVDGSHNYGHAALPPTYSYATDGYKYQDGGDSYNDEGFSSWT